MTELGDLGRELLWVVDKLLCTVNSQVAQLQPGGHIYTTCHSISHTLYKQENVLLSCNTVYEHTYVGV